MALTKEDLQAIQELFVAERANTQELFVVERANIQELFVAERANTSDMMDAKLQPMKDDIKAVKVTLENEVKRDISLIRESQLDQARNTEELRGQVDSIERKLDNSVIVKAVTPSV